MRTQVSNAYSNKQRRDSLGVDSVCELFSYPKMIRFLRQSDIPRLRELTQADVWSFGPDFMQGLVLTDSQDAPVMFVGAWQRAEVHLAVDASWSTPGARMEALKQLHDAMEQGLAAKGVGQVVTWLGESDSPAFRRRLKVLGWVESVLISWHRRVG